MQRDLSIAVHGPTVKVKAQTDRGRRFMKYQGKGDEVRLPLQEGTILAEAARDNGVSMFYEGKI